MVRKKATSDITIYILSYCSFRSSCSFCSNYVSSLTGFPFTLSSSVSIFLLPYNPSILKDLFPCIVSLIKCTFFYYFFRLFIFISERYVHPLSDLDRKQLKRFKSVNGCIAAINEWKSFFSFNKWVTYFLWYVTTLFFLAFLLIFWVHYYTVFLSLKWFLKLSFCLKKGFFVLFVIVWYIAWYIVLRNAVKKECNIEEKDVMPSKKRVAWSCPLFYFWCIHLLLWKSTL